VVFRDSRSHTVEPDPDDLAGYARFMERYRAGLAIESSAAAAL